MKNTDTVATIANDAVDQLQVAREYLARFDSLSWAVSNSLKEDQGRHATQLAELVRYLATDYLYTLDCDIKSFNDRLNDLDVRG